MAWQNGTRLELPNNADGNSHRVTTLLIRKNTIGFLLYSMIFYIGMLGLLDVLVNFYFASLGNSSETIGLLQSLPRLAGFLTSVPLGFLTNRIGTRRMLILATIGCVLANWMQLIPILPMLAISRFFFGLAYGAQQIANAPLIVEMVEPRLRTGFFALHNLLTMGAMAFGSFIGGYLPGWITSATQSFVPDAWTASATTPFAYGGALFAAGLISLIGILPILKLKAGARYSDAPAVQHTTSTPAKTPWLMLALAALPMLTFGFSGGLTFPFYNLFWREQFALPDQNVGTILSIGWLGMAAIPMINSAMESRFGRANALRLMMIISAAAFFVLGLLPALVISVTVFVIAISSRNTMNPLFQPLVLESLPPSLSNLASSMMLVMWNIGWFAATAAGGFIAERFGYGVIMVLTAITVLMTGFSIPIIFRQPSLLGNRLAWDESAR